MQINLSIPQKWNDLSTDQLQNIAFQFHLYQQIVKDSPQTEGETSARLFLQLSKELLRGNKWQSIRVALKEMQPKAFAPLVKFLYDTADRTKFIPSVKVDGLLFHSPGQRIRNITIGEFSFADAVFYKWKQTKQPIWLTVLCATLYRPVADEQNDMDIRKEFVKQAVDARADIFQALPLKTKLAIGATYEGCRNHIAETFPLIFSKPTEIEGMQKPKPGKYVSFGEIVLQKIDGDPSKLMQTNNVLAYDFLNIINNDIKNFRKQKK
ncbi:hypothetical protein LCGC14_1807370 [marine sediment metagenome]|uniref:Uncharacterized protein n=2 Tax=root TaxID=1 RepID=A0A831VTW7_9FLAO|nr:hypothetical protein [Pricia antarctica]